MIEKTYNYAETTDYENTSEPLSDALRAMRISGSILINEDYLPPWGVDIPNADRLRSLMTLENGVRVVAFHLVKRGYIEITTPE